MVNQRSSGVLLHPTSLPSSGGIGDLGPAAYAFADWLAETKQSLWQVLPLGPVGYGNSPYSCTSAFAGNVLIISLERLAEKGYLDKSQVPDSDAAGAVDFDEIHSRKLPLLREAATNFLRSASSGARDRYDGFRRSNQWWLEDYSLFAVLREHYHEGAWNHWPLEIASRAPE